MVESTNNVNIAGEEIYAWKAHNYHPHERGILWTAIFILIFVGTALWSLLADPGWFGKISAFSIIMVAAIYFWSHRNGNEDHEVVVFEKGLLIDERAFFKWEKFEGFWFVYDETVAIVNFEYKGNGNRKITLQLGEVIPDELRNKMEECPLEELEERRESILDLWIRALKL